MVRSLRALVVASWVVGLAPAVAAYESMQGPTEVLLWNQAKAFNGYTLFGAHGTTYVIDMLGNVVHKWAMVGTNPKLLDNGHILDAARDDPSRFGGFVEVDWDGAMAVSYTHLTLPTIYSV